MPWIDSTADYVPTALLQIPPLPPALVNLLRRIVGARNGDDLWSGLLDGDRLIERDEVSLEFTEQVDARRLPSIFLDVRPPVGRRRVGSAGVRFVGVRRHGAPPERET